MDAEGVLSKPFDLSGKRVWVAGHGGMVGSAVLRRLKTENVRVQIAGRHDVDLRNQVAVDRWVSENRPEVIVIAAAKVGGIWANNIYPVDFLYDNMMIEANIIHAAHKNGVEKLLFLGTSCIYPREALQPIREEYLLSGPLEETNQWYAIAKIAGIRLCQAYRRQHGCDYISAMPCSLYGPGDTFDAEKSHVIPALLMKAHKAKQEGDSSLSLWGTGKPLREFMYVDDLADALVFLLKNYSGESHINVGSGEDVCVRDLAEMIADVAGFKGDLVFDDSKPDGTPRKLMDSTRMFDMGWKPQTSLEDGLRKAYEWYLANV